MSDNVISGTIKLRDGWKWYLYLKIESDDPDAIIMIEEQSGDALTHTSLNSLISTDERIVKISDNVYRFDLYKGVTPLTDKMSIYAEKDGVSSEKINIGTLTDGIECENHPNYATSAEVVIPLNDSTFNGSSISTYQSQTGNSDPVLYSDVEGNMYAFIKVRFNFMKPTSLDASCKLCLIHDDAEIDDVPITNESGTDVCHDDELIRLGPIPSKYIDSSDNTITFECQPIDPIRVDGWEYRDPEFSRASMSTYTDNGYSYVIATSHTSFEVSQNE